MSRKTLYLLGIVLTIILGTFLYIKFCCNCCMKTSPVATENVQTTADKDIFVPFILNGSGIDYQTHDNIKFLKNSANLTIPVSDSVVLGIEKLKTFLIANPKQKVTIIGYAISDETNSTAFESLALARAEDIKNYFVSKGLSASQFITKGEIIDNWKMSLDTLLGPAAYKFDAIDTATATASDEWSVLKDKINANPLLLHFSTNKASDDLSAIEKQKVADIVKYMEHDKNATVLIVGHTDDVGNREANVVLGQKRAEFSKNYLSKNGIDASRIATESKGPDEPAGQNSTAEGKATNRRTVITIK